MVRFILPIKGLGRGKSRLRVDAGRRAELVEAMFLDTLEAVLWADLGPAVVVSPDPDVHDVAEHRGAQSLHHPGRLNEAIAAAVTPGVCAAILPDLPALRAAELRDVFARFTTGFVPDWSGVGTTMLFGKNLQPHFGPDSARRHDEAGYPRLPVTDCGLTVDVDTWPDLERAEHFGLGRNTAALMDRLRADPAVRIGP